MGQVFYPHEKRKGAVIIVFRKINIFTGFSIRAPVTGNDLQGICMITVCDRNTGIGRCRIKR